MTSEGQSPMQMLSDLYKFYKFVNEKMPNSAAENFLEQVNFALFVIPSLKITLPVFNTNEMDELENKYKTLKTQIEEFKGKRDEELSAAHPGTGTNNAHKNRKALEFERRWMEPPPEDFRSIPVIPTIQELLSGEKAFLRPSLIKGQYPSAQDYLDVHFRLLREDFVDPLREGIQQYFRNR